MENNKLTTYPEGFMMAADALDFLPEEARADFMIGLILSVMMETA